MIQVRVKDIWPLSPMQEGLLFHALYDEQGFDPYMVQHVLDVRGHLDAQAFRASWAALLARHDNLRASFRQPAGLDQPVQVVAWEVELPWREADLSGLSGKAMHAAEAPHPELTLAEGSGEPALAEAERLAGEEREQRFDLAAAPLMRFLLIRMGPERHRLVLTSHHILMDGWSLPIMLRELSEIYAAGASASGLPPVTPYREYLAWLARQDRDAARAAWAAELAGLDQPTLVAGSDRARAPTVPERVSVRASAELSEALLALARVLGVTLNTVVQGGWALLVGKLTGSADVVFGATVAGRPPELAGVEHMLGLFINTVPVRVRLDPALSVAELLAGLHQRQSALIGCQHLGLAEIQKAAGPGAAFDTLVVYENYPRGPASPPGAATGAGPGPGAVKIIPIEALGHDATHYPLTLAVGPGRRLGFRLDYRPDLFDQRGAQEIIDRLVWVLEQLAGDRAIRVSQVQVLEGQERERLVWEWAGPVAPAERSGGDVDYPYISPTDLMIERAVDAPDSIAVSHGMEKLTYRQFAARVNQLSHRLRGAGVGIDTVVGVCLPRSVDLLVTVHAIAAAGGAYLPLDPELPAQRLSLMAGDANALIIVTWSGNSHEDGVFDGLRLLTVDRERASLDAEPCTPLGLTVPPDALAYVIFTSGSTGTPKGAGISYKSLVNRIAWMQQYFPLSPADRVLHKTPFGFDVSVWELFWPLSVGARVIVADPGGHRDPGYLAALMEREAATVVHFVPSVLDVFLDEVRSAGRPPTLRLVFASGEALSGDVAARTLDILPRARLHNLYGPTEAAVDVTWQPVLQADQAIPVPIGRPVPNTRIEVLSAELQRCPADVPGELCLGGVQLARGYVSRPSLTAERFVPDPYSPSGDRLYRTGDLVRLRTDGVLEYLGRLDTQTKINGLRIELGEIEMALASEPEVRAAAVTAVNDGAGKRLVAYLVPATSSGTKELESCDWAGRLRDRLPSYMIPAQYVTMAELPLSRNGKLDRTALPVPETPVQAAAGDLLAPGAETTVATVWREVLGIAYVGPEDNFFSIGGDSMRSLRVVSRLQAAGYALTLEDLFTHSTPRALATLLEEPRPEDRPPPRDGVQAASAAPDGAPASGAFRLLGAEDRARLEAMGIPRKDLG